MGADEAPCRKPVSQASFPFHLTTCHQRHLGHRQATLWQSDRVRQWESKTSKAQQSTGPRPVSSSVKGVKQTGPLGEPVRARHPAPGTVVCPVFHPLPPWRRRCQRGLFLPSFRSYDLQRWREFENPEQFVGLLPLLSSQHSSEATSSF